MSETPTERNRRIFHEATARDEPVFVIRAQDRYAAEAVRAYAEVVDPDDPGFLDALDRLRLEITEWQQANPDKVKTPDLRADPRAAERAEVDATDYADLDLDSDPDPG